MSERPTLRIINSDATEEEIAAILAVIFSRSSIPNPTPTRSEWNHPARLARGPHRFGPGVWTRSAFGTR